MDTERRNRKQREAVKSDAPTLAALSRSEPLAKTSVANVCQALAAVEREESVVTVCARGAHDPGLHQDAREQVFEPLYTTEPFGAGLPHLRSIARRHGGNVRIEHDPSGGTRVVLSVSA